MATRWGICSAGLISQDFCGALLTLPRDQHQIVTVAARDRNRAEEFAKRFGIPKAYGSYEELAKDPDVDIVYLGTVSTTHRELSLFFLNHGKPVLCEKPVCLSLKSLQEVLSTARSKNLFFMEAFWTRCSPVFDRVRQEMDSGNLGDVKMISCRAIIDLRSFETQMNPRLGGGGLMKLGCYMVMVTNIFLKGKPLTITVEGDVHDGLDDCGVITLRYSEGRIASLVYNVVLPGSPLTGNTLLVAGTKGKMEVGSPFLCPTRLIGTNGEVQEFPLPETDHKFNYVNSAALRYEAEHVRQCLQKGLKESPLMNHEDSETIMYILENIQKQLGLVYTD